MRTSLLASFLFAAVAAIAPPPPAPASDAETEIAPDDQIHFAPDDAG